MKTLLLTTTLILSALLQAQDALSIALQNDMTGSWYIKAIVANHEPPQEKKPKSMSPITVTALNGGILEATHTFMKHGQCHEMNLILQPTEEPGKYTTNEGKSVVQIQEILIGNHIIVFVECHLHRKPFLMAKLMGRNPELDFNALEEFKNFTQYKGLPDDKIFLPTQTEKCIPESESI